MSSKDTLTLKERLEIGGKKALATTLIALGAIGMAGCADKVGAEPKPSTSQSQTETPSETPSATTSPTEKPSESPSETPTNPESKVPKIRENWKVNEAALEKLGSLAKYGGEGDLAAVRAEVCTEFFANNPLGDNFPAPTSSDKVEAVEARFEAKQQLLRDYISDKFRDDQWRTDVNAADMLTGVQSCVTNGVDSKGATDAGYIDAVVDDKPLSTVTTSPKEYSFKDPSEGYVRTSYVSVAVEGQTPADVWRRFLWNEKTQDWDITNEQAENPYNLGWK